MIGKYFSKSTHRSKRLTECKLINTKKTMLRFASLSLTLTHTHIHIHMHTHS
jgi:hypothetical protein